MVVGSIEGVTVGGGVGMDGAIVDVGAGVG